MKNRIVFFTFLIIFSLLFAACGRTADPNCGSYVCEQLVMGEEKIKVDTVYSQAPVLELFNSGEAFLEIDGKSYSGKWKNINGSFSLTIGQHVSVGELDNGICSVELMDTGLVYNFFSVNSPLPQWGNEKNRGEKENVWSGDWYGYWSLSNAEGDWESLDGQSFDCFAHIDMYSDGEGQILIWDESGKIEDPMAKVRLSLSNSNSGVYGTARSEGGNFYTQEIGKSRWVIRPDSESIGQLISFSSHYSSGEGSFDYLFRFRPWGCLWDDVLAEREIPLPYYYYDWYLPTLSTNDPMPDQVNFAGIAVKPEKIYRGDVD